MDATDKIQVVEKYVEAFATGDIGIIKEMYASDARLEDPVGSPVVEGLEAVCRFYERALKGGAKLTLTGTPRCTGNAVAFSFRAEMPGRSIDIIDVFEFDAEGKVASMKAYWGPENVRS